MKKITDLQLLAQYLGLPARIIHEAIEMVEICDPDGCYTLFEDEGMYDHANAVELIYFENGGLEACVAEARKLMTHE